MDTSLLAALGEEKVGLARRTQRTTASLPRTNAILVSGEIGTPSKDRPPSLLRPGVRVSRRGSVDAENNVIAYLDFTLAKR